MRTKSNFRKFLTLGAITTALLVQSAASALAAPAPGPIRSLDSQSDELLSDVKREYNRMGKRDRARFRHAVEEAQEFETAVDRLRSAVENRRGHRTVQAELGRVNSEFRDVERALDRRGIGRDIRGSLHASRQSLFTANRVLSGDSRHDRRDDRHDDRYDRHDDRRDDRGDHRAPVFRIQL